MRSILVIGVLFALVAASASPQCRTAEHRQFDFWLGDWDAYELSDTAKAVARVQVNSIMDGRVGVEVGRKLDAAPRDVVAARRERAAQGRPLDRWRQDMDPGLGHGVPAAPQDVSVRRCNIPPKAWIRSPDTARPQPGAVLRW